MKDLAVESEFQSRRYCDSYDSDREYRPLREEGKIAQILEPVISQLQRYDDLRRQLEERGGSLSFLNRLTFVLNEAICVQTYWGEKKAALSDQKGLRNLLRDVGYYRVHLDIRRLAYGLPVYYLFREEEDYWSEYSVIVEDLYRSPGFTIVDERFIKRMRMGHEEFALRLSHFRADTARMLNADAERDAQKIDSLIYKLGRHIFQAAWHDDQRPGFLTGRHFGLVNFLQAIELLYLCLSGELCELRGAVNEEMYNFLRTVYPQPAIEKFLQKLVTMEGGEINEIPKNTLSLYGKLSQAFSHFLNTEVVWGAGSQPVALYKLIFANLNRLHWVAEKLQDNQALVAAKNGLEKTAKDIVECIAMQK